MLSFFTRLIRARDFIPTRRAQGELQRAVRMRDDFMSMVSHEIRTPLNALSLQAQVRRRLSNGAQLSSSQMQDMVERDEQQIKNILRLVDDLLDMSRLHRGAMRISPQPVDLVALVRRVVEVHADQAQAMGSPIHLDTPAEIPGFWDDFRIEQVVTNLVTNGMRYGGGKPLHISVRNDGGEAAIGVQDQGIGIAPTHHHRIFERFERVVNAGAAPGLGLGLYISFQIVRAHGGRIYVNSAPGKGSTFTVRLPKTPHFRYDPICALAGESEKRS